MPRSARFGLPAAAALFAAVAGAAGPLLPAGATTAPSVHVHGHLLVVGPEVPGEQPAYAVALADGDIVPVRGRFGSDVRTGAVFDGRLAVPTSVVEDLSARGESGSAAALTLVDRRSLTLSVIGTPAVTAAAPAVTATTHDQFVAAIDNLGALGQSDPQLLGHVTTVGSYWGEESNGAIAGITVPTTVTHYSTGLTTSDCGLGSDFFSVVQEAADEFPAFDDFSGSDQLVLFVPPSCGSGSVVGEGTVGSSFASGGALVVKAGNAIEGTYAHETGHNYGFQHANARYAGTSMEYYGVYDVMGFALDGFNQLTALSTPFRVFQGITDPGEIQVVPIGDGRAAVRATATIRPRSDHTGVRSVRVKNPDTGQNLYLDFRSGTGQDTGAFYADTAHGYYLSSSHGPVHYAPGVVITAARGNGGTDELVVDATGDTSLGSGDTWRNASHTLAVHVTSLGAAAHVTVDYTLRSLASAKPTISGRPRVGGTLTAKHGAWTPGTTFAYAWYADGKRIRHRTSSKLTLARAQRGKHIKVKVTGTKPGYTRASRTSARTVAVS
jgi:hypothetical protein